MLRIFHTHPARTSLLQDFAFYEVYSYSITFLHWYLPTSPPQLQSMQKLQGQVQAPPSPQSTNSPSPPVQHAFAMGSPNALAYASQHFQMPQMSPMMQMQMQMASPFANPHAMQSVMRNASPVPVQPGQGYVGISGVPGFSS